MELKGKIILVTGASGGIGREVVKALEKEEAEIICHNNSQIISSSHFSLKADFKNKNEIREMFEAIKAKYSFLDGMINTVGIEEQQKDQLDTDNWQNMMKVNLYGAVECAKHAKELMKLGGVIINISSIMGNKGIVGQESLAYSVSKAALIKFSENLALMLAPKIRVVSISPGYTRTPIWNGFSEKQKKGAVDLIPINRFLEPSEIADFIVSIVKNEALTGGNLTIDGGLGSKSIT